MRHDACFLVLFVYRVAREWWSTTSWRLWIISNNKRRVCLQGEAGVKTNEPIASVFTAQRICILGRQFWPSPRIHRSPTLYYCIMDKILSEFSLGTLSPLPFNSRTCKCYFLHFHPSFRDERVWGEFHFRIIWKIGWCCRVYGMMMQWSMAGEDNPVQWNFPREQTRLRRRTTLICVFHPLNEHLLHYNLRQNASKREDLIFDACWLVPINKRNRNALCIWPSLNDKSWVPLLDTHKQHRHSAGGIEGSFIDQNKKKYERISRALLLFRWPLPDRRCVCVCLGNINRIQFCMQTKHLAHILRAQCSDGAATEQFGVKHIHVHPKTYSSSVSSMKYYCGEWRQSARWLEAAYHPPTANYMYLYDELTMHGARRFFLFFFIYENVYSADQACFSCWRRHTDDFSHVCCFFFILLESATTIQFLQYLWPPLFDGLHHCWRRCHLSIRNLLLSLWPEEPLAD